jgi:phage-related protein
LPRIEVILYREADGKVPFLEWCAALTSRMQDKVRIKIERLAEEGHALRRPEADYLAEGIYELRIIRAGVGIRVLYFFHGRGRAVISHGFIKKQQKVPERELRTALKHMARYRLRPDWHTYRDH